MELRKNLLIKNEMVIVIEEPKKDTRVPRYLSKRIPARIDNGAIVKKRKEKIKYNPRIDKKIIRGCFKTRFSS